MLDYLNRKPEFIEAFIRSFIDEGADTGIQKSLECFGVQEISERDTAGKELQT